VNFQNRLVSISTCLAFAAVIAAALPAFAAGEDVISISIFDQVQALDYGAANQTALVLLLFSFLVLAITYGLQRRVIAVWPPR
jgi:ABC-type molybdate transport system permease subunit